MEIWHNVHHHYCVLNPEDSGGLVIFQFPFDQKLIIIFSRPYGDFSTKIDTLVSFNFCFPLIILKACKFSRRWVKENSYCEQSISPIRCVLYVILVQHGKCTLFTLPASQVIQFTVEIDSCEGKHAIPFPYPIYLV